MLTESELLIRESLDKMCAVEVPKYQNDAFYNTVPRALFTSLASLGVAGLAIPEKYGGLGAPATTTTVVMETLSKHDLGPAIFISVHSMVSGLISRFGSEPQKQEVLSKMAEGKLLGAFALTEPKAGSDASALATEARNDGDSFIIKGGKCYITSAGFAELYIVFAKTSDKSGSGISAFIVPSTTPGLTIGKPEKKMGCELSPIASLFFDDAKIPASALLGPIHGGYKAALSGLAGGRVNIAACANGLSKAAIEISRKYLNDREQFGRPLYEFQGLQFMLADMYCKYEAAQLLTWKAATELEYPLAEGGMVNTKLSSSVAKCFATDAAMAITTDAVQLLGGAGYIREYSVERLMRDAKMLQIVEGTNQIQRMIIARELREEV
jgi:alkylation response protein AidB-like acyl-CoA dehydrogenase